MTSVRTEKENHLSRRQLLYTLCATLTSLVGAIFLGKKFHELNSYIPLGPVTAFKPGSVTTFEAEHLYLVRLHNGGFMAMSRACTHLRCTVPWIEAKKQFVCPCHGSSYSLDGSLLSPPASRGLDTFKLKIRNNQVLVNLTKIHKRDRSAS